LRYQSEDYFSVIETRTGRKICDCGTENDAMLMVLLDLQNRTYTRNQFMMGQVVDIQIPKQLPTNELVVVEKEPPQPQKKLKQHQNKLPESDLQPLNL